MTHIQSNHIENPKWKQFFKHEPNNIDCKHCKFQNGEDSIPTEVFNCKKYNAEGEESTEQVLEIHIYIQGTKI